MADLYQRPPRAPQPGHPPATCTFAAGRSPPRRIDEQPFTVDARHAGDLLWRRDRDGRQHPSWRSQRRTYTDAVVAGSERRILSRRSRSAGVATADGSALWLRDDQRRSAKSRPTFTSQLDATHACDPSPTSLLWPWHADIALSQKSQGAGLPS